MLIANLAACSLFALQSGAPAAKPATEKPAPSPARIAVIGASASAGYNVHVSLADALDLQIAVQHDAPKSFAKEAMFIEPMTSGEEQVRLAAALRPTLVIAADFLFWFGYGDVGVESERLLNLDLGLELLDELHCPLVISHFPDMTPAVGKMLIATQVPKRETLLALDARLDAWAKARGQVAFVAMAEMLDKLRTGEKLSVGGVEFVAPASRARLIQPDELHPTAEGLGVLARLCIDAACTGSVGAKPAQFRGELEPALESLRKLEESRAKASHGEVGDKAAPPKPRAGKGSFDFVLARN